MFWLLHQLLGARELQRGVDLGRLGLGEIGALLLDRRLVGVLLDPEQQVAGLDDLAFGEEPLLDEALDARDDIDLVDRRDAADEIRGLADLAAHHRHHRHRRRRCPLSQGRTAPSDEHRRRQRPPSD